MRKNAASPRNRAHEQVHFMLVARCHVGEEFLVYRHDGGAVEIRAAIGQKEVNELDEEGAEEFFEQAVMIHTVIVPSLRLFAISVPPMFAPVGSAEKRWFLQ